LGAIQAAGGFTIFSDKKRVSVTRVDGTIITVRHVLNAKNPYKDLPIYPGDRIWVPIVY
jgi:protein involved in polysaccharide export with SLBB domain